MIALTFHTEKLHDEKVYKKLMEFLNFANKHLNRPKFTFFVYPFRAVVAGKDIKDKIKLLYNSGYEIGQHTHFYKGDKIEKPFKQNDLSRENIKYCLKRDLTYIENSIGIRPKGFVAGGWLINDTIMKELINLDFTYDISFFSKNTKPFVFEYKGKRLFELPTDYSIGEYFKNFSFLKDRKEFKILYLHDYDLLRPSVYVSLKMFILMNKHKKFVSVGDIICKMWKSEKNTTS